MKNTKVTLLAVCFYSFFDGNLFAMEQDQNLQEPLLSSTKVTADVSMSPVSKQLSHIKLSSPAKNSPYKSDKRLIKKMSAVKGVYSPDSVKNSLNRRSQVNSRMIEGTPFSSPVISTRKKNGLNFDAEVAVSPSANSSGVTSLGSPKLTRDVETMKHTAELITVLGGLPIQAQIMQR